MLYVESIRYLFSILKKNDFVANHRVLDNLLNKMLPEKLQDLDKELSEEEIRSTIYRQTTRFLHESFLLKKYEGNITLDHKLINLRASLVFQIRKHEQSKQKLQRKLVSFVKVLF